jgi:hypothetical protein
LGKGYHTHEYFGIFLRSLRGGWVDAETMAIPFYFFDERWDERRLESARCSVRLVGWLLYSVVCFGTFAVNIYPMEWNGWKAIGQIMAVHNRYFNRSNLITYIITSTEPSYLLRSSSCADIETSPLHHGPFSHTTGHNSPNPPSIPRHRAPLYIIYHLLLHSHMTPLSQYPYNINPSTPNTDRHPTYLQSPLPITHHYPS